MINFIRNGKDIALNAQAGNVPNVGDALRAWFQPMVFTRIVKTTKAFQVVETPTDYPFLGVIQPFTDRQLQMKPEGQRAWTWFLMHSDPILTLEVDEIVTYLGVPTRVMARADYSLYGYISYHLCQDYS